MSTAIAASTRASRTASRTARRWCASRGSSSEGRVIPERAPRRGPERSTGEAEPPSPVAPCGVASQPWRDGLTRSSWRAQDPPMSHPGEPPRSPFPVARSVAWACARMSVDSPSTGRPSPAAHRGREHTHAALARRSQRARVPRALRRGLHLGPLGRAGAARGAEPPHRRAGRRAAARWSGAGSPSRSAGRSTPGGHREPRARRSSHDDAAPTSTSGPGACASPRTTSASITTARATATSTRSPMWPTRARSMTGARGDGHVAGRGATRSRC